MAAQSRFGFNVLVSASFVIATFIAIYPLSIKFSELRPELVCLLVIYWLLANPNQFGVFFAWCIGFAQDFIEGSVWGGHALALAIVAYVCLMAQQRFKNYSVWHQGLWIFILVGLHQVMTNWVQSLAGYEATTKVLVLSSVVTALFWPPISILLTRTRFKYRLG